jgi:hypothetical protein
VARGSEVPTAIVSSRHLARKIFMIDALGLCIYAVNVNRIGLAVLNIAVSKS